MLQQPNNKSDATEFIWKFFSYIKSSIFQKICKK